MLRRIVRREIAKLYRWHNGPAADAGAPNQSGARFISDTRLGLEAQVPRHSRRFATLHPNNHVKHLMRFNIDTAIKIGRHLQNQDTVNGRVSQKSLTQRKTLQSLGYKAKN